MRWIAAYSMVLLLVQTSGVRGDDSTTSRPAAALQASTRPAAASATFYACCSGADEAAPSSALALDKLDHVLKAAEHLEAAGMADQAKQLRKQHEQLKLAHDEALLQQRLAELDRLQAEVDDLKRKTGREGQILIHVQALELSLTKLRESNAVMKRTPGGSPSALVNFILKTNGGLAPATVLDRTVIAESVVALREEKLLKILAEPTLVTVDGRPIFFNSGGEFPILVRQSDRSLGVDFKKYGTQVDLVGKLMGAGRIRMEIKLRISDLDPTLNVTAEGVTVPGLNVREVDTGVEMELGKTAVISGLASNRPETIVDPKTKQEHEVIHEVETIFLVTPELVEGTALSPAALERPARR